MSSYDPIDKALNTQSSEIVGVGVDKTSVDLSNKPEEIQKDNWEGAVDGR